MKPNFNPKSGDIVRVRHHELGVVDAEYLRKTETIGKNHFVKVNTECYRAQKLRPHSGIVLDRVRFVYTVECMPDYRRKL